MVDYRPPYPFGLYSLVHRVEVGLRIDQALIPAELHYTEDPVEVELLAKKICAVI